MIDNTNTRRVPVISGGGSVHVTHVESDVKSISVNGGEHCLPDAEGNINVLVPRIVAISRADYNALAEVDDNTIYLVW